MLWAKDEKGKKVMSKHMPLARQKTYNIEMTPRKQEKDAAAGGQDSFFDEDPT